MNEAGLAAALGLAEASLEPPRTPPVPSTPPNRAPRNTAFGSDRAGGGSGNSEYGHRVVPSAYSSRPFSDVGLPATVLSFAEEKSAADIKSVHPTRAMASRSMYLDEDGRVGIVPGHFVRSESRRRQRGDAARDRTATTSLSRGSFGFSLGVLWI